MDNISTALRIKPRVEWENLPPPAKSNLPFYVLGKNKNIKLGNYCCKETQQTQNFNTGVRGTKNWDRLNSIKPQSKRSRWQRTSIHWWPAVGCRVSNQQPEKCNRLTANDWQGLLLGDS